MADTKINALANVTPQTPVISKVKIGTQTYWLKDDEARKVLALLESGAFTAVSTPAADAAAGSVVNASNNNLVTGAQVADAISALTGAMHFVGVKTSLDQVTDPKSGDIAIVGTKEYVYDGSKWAELGDEGTYETKTQTQAIKIADVTLGTDYTITTAELKTALGLGNMAYANTASGTVAAQTITGVKATGDVTGTATITTTSTEMASTGKFTPAGSITGSAIKGGSIDVTVKDAATATAVTDITYDSYTPAGDITGTVVPTGTVAIAKSTSGTQISGTVSTPTITVTPTVATGNKGVTNAGSQASWEATVTDETLEFAWTANTVPTLGTADVVTGITSATSTQPTFTGDKFGATFTGNADGDAISATFAGTADNIKFAGAKYLKQEIDTKTFTPQAATLGFSGTEGDLSVTGNYDKVNASATVSAENVSLNVGDIAVTAKNVTVTPDA